MALLSLVRRKAESFPANLLSEAERLYRKKHYTAAAMLVRPFVERTLKARCPLDYKPDGRGLGPICSYLVKHGLISQQVANLAHSIYARASNACHLGQVDQHRVSLLIWDTRKLQAAIAET